MRESESREQEGSLKRIGLSPMTVAALIGYLSLLAILYLVSQGMQQAEIENSERTLTTIASVKKDQLMEWRSDRLALAAYVMSDNSLIDTVGRLQRDESSDYGSELHDLFDSLARYNALTDIRLVDQSGKTLYSLSGEDITLHQEAMRGLLEAIGVRSPVITDLHTMESDQESHIDIIAPLIWKDAETQVVLGAVVMEADVTRTLLPLILAWPVPTETAETLLVRKKGDSIQFLNVLRHQKEDSPGLSLPLNRTNLPAVMAVEGHEGIVSGLDYRGVEVIAFTEKVPESPWYMIVKMDRSEALKTWRRQAGLLLVFFVLMTILLILLMVLSFHNRKRDQLTQQLETERSRRIEEARWRQTLMSVGDAIITTDRDGRVEMLNPIAEDLTGWPLDEARGRTLDEVFRIINELTREPATNPVRKIVASGKLVGLANHTVLISRDGRERPIADSGAPIFDEAGIVSGVVLVFRDQTIEREITEVFQESAMVDAALAALSAALLDPEKSITEIAEIVLAHARALTGSSQGYVSSINRETGDLLIHSMTSMLRKEGEVRELNMPLIFHRDAHGYYPGLWGVVLNTRTAFFTDDPQSHPSARGFPGGHVPITSFLTVPVVVGSELLGQIALANSSRDYDQGDLDTIERLAGYFGLYLQHRRDIGDLAASEEKFRTYIDFAPDGIFVTDENGNFVDVNPAASKITGYSRGELLAMNLADFCHPDERDMALRGFQSLLDTGRVYFEAQYLHKNGTFRHWSVNASKLSETRFLGFTLDITDRIHGEEEQKKLRIQLEAAQKLETVGRLAGGIAHDFNNMLGVILGHTELMTMLPGLPQSLEPSVQEILKAAKRAADLTRQLLGFARRQTVSPKILDINETIGGSMKMYRRLMGENVAITWTPGASLWNVTMDPLQIDQVLVNLLDHARRTISDNATITLTTSNVTIDDNYYQSNPTFIPGHFVRLSISNTGHGISEEELTHIFEPFFSREGFMKVGGLALATVYGIVKQNNGYIDVTSEPSIGTTFAILLPRSQVSESDVMQENGPEISPTGTETILIAEDELAILEICNAVLERQGYHIIAANSPSEACHRAHEYDGMIHLLISDAIMPEMNGRQLVMELRKKRPNLRCLFMSGYSSDVIAHHGILNESSIFIQKPFSVNDLVVKVREALDAADSKISRGN